MDRPANPICADCRHCHSRIYGDTYFCCAMHPYGPDGESCKDWEAKLDLWDTLQQSIQKGVETGRRFSERKG